MQGKQTWKMIVWVAVIVVVILILAGWYLIHPSATPTKLSNTVVNVPSSMLPNNFPTNLPLYGQVQVVDNFNAASPNGQTQATRSFDSIKSVSANFTAYKTFLAQPSSGWTIIAESTSSVTQESLLAKNASGFLTVAVSSIPPNPMPLSLVQITYTTNPITGTTGQ